MIAGSIAAEPIDWVTTGLDCMEGECNGWTLLALLPFIPGSLTNKTDDIVDVVRKMDGVELQVDDTLDLATAFLGKEYRELKNSRFLSADGYRQVRMSLDDITGHGKQGRGHITLNFWVQTLRDQGSIV
jgi:hypothetical protein